MGFDDIGCRTHVLQVLLLLLTIAHEGFGVKLAPPGKPDIATLHHASTECLWVEWPASPGPAVKVIK